MGDASSMRDGNADGVADLYARYSGKVLQLARRMCGDREHAEEIVQETFARVAAKYHTFRGESDVGTWIYRIARNECIRALGRAKRGSFRRFQRLVDEAPSPEPPALSAIERSSYVGQVREGCLLGLLRCLPVSQRMAFIFCVLFELPAGEVSVIMGKSVNSVRILATRARARLKSFLCGNCSLYDTANPCRCESFISFSLKKGWIRPAGPSDPAHSVMAITAELAVMRDEVTIYRSLAETDGLPGPLEELLPKWRERGLLLAKKK